MSQFQPMRLLPLSRVFWPSLAVAAWQQAVAREGNRRLLHQTLLRYP